MNDEILNTIENGKNGENSIRRELKLLRTLAKGLVRVFHLAARSIELYGFVEHKFIDIDQRVL